MIYDVDSDDTRQQSLLFLLVLLLLCCCSQIQFEPITLWLQNDIKHKKIHVTRFEAHSRMDPQCALNNWSSLSLCIVMNQGLTKQDAMMLMSVYVG